MLVIVPDIISETILCKVDAIIKEKPELKAQRENIYHDILKIYNDTGVIPDFDAHLSVISV